MENWAGRKCEPMEGLLDGRWSSLFEISFNFDIARDKDIIVKEAHLGHGVRTVDLNQN